MKSFLLTVTLLLGTLAAAGAFSAESTPYIQVGKAKTRKSVIAFPPITIAGDISSQRRVQTFTENLSKTLQSDLLFMDVFTIQTDTAGADVLLDTKLTSDGNAMQFHMTLQDVVQKKEIAKHVYVADVQEGRLAGHNVANDVVEKLTGLKGIFLTKIVTSCDGTGKKELYVMGFDGSESRQVTAYRSLAFAPAWHPNGKHVAYSLYTWHRNRIRNIDLFEMDVTTGSVRMLSNKTGINSGAAYSPDGKWIAMTMSFLGNPDIFLMNRESRTVDQLTKSFGFDVDPAFSPDGKSLAFVSSRSGKPMVFKMDLSGKNVERLTYAGDYNATPNWSPRGDKIVFAGWIDKTFDIFTMNSDGTKIERLTKAQGNNEDPMYSPDGNFIVFSSNRAGKKNVYVMNTDGSFVKRITYGLGNCVAPRWSNTP